MSSAPRLEASCIHVIILERFASTSPSFADPWKRATTVVFAIPGADPGYWERGGGGSDKYIHNWGRGRAPPVTARGVWGSADSSPSGVWGFAPAAFLLLCLCMKFTIHIHHVISGLLEPAWIATRKLFILHNAMVPTAQQLNS